MSTESVRSAAAAVLRPPARAIVEIEHRLSTWAAPHTRRAAAATIVLMAISAYYPYTALLAALWVSSGIFAFGFFGQLVDRGEGDKP